MQNNTTNVLLDRVHHIIVLCFPVKVKGTVDLRGQPHKNCLTGPYLSRTEICFNLI